MQALVTSEKQRRFGQNKFDTLPKYCKECPVLFAGEAAELAQDGLMGSQVACLGSEGRLMRRRLQQYLAEHLDT
mgnify:CR=1 FL=1